MNFVNILKENFTDYNIINLSFFPLKETVDNIVNYSKDEKNIIYIMKTVDNLLYFKHYESIAKNNMVNFLEIDRIIIHQEELIFLSDKYNSEENLIRNVRKLLLISDTSECIVCYNNINLNVCLKCRTITCIPCCSKLPNTLCPVCREKITGFN